MDPGNLSLQVNASWMRLPCHHCEASLPGCYYKSIIDGSLFHGDQFIGAAAEADLLGMLERFLPAYVRVAVKEMVVMMVPVRFREVVSELTVADRRGSETSVNAGLIEGNRIKGGEHSDIRKNRSVILRVAVAVR